MKRKIITTADGSKTIQIEDWDEQYHSKHGALQEAQYVFVKQGLQHFVNAQTNNEWDRKLAVLEMGFGTGLNALLTAVASEKLNLNIHYVGVEAYPVSTPEIEQLDYAKLVGKTDEELFQDMHKHDWEVFHEITPAFNLQKRQQFFNNITDINAFNIIYFDAFGARVQPELWTPEIFSKMYDALKPGGVLVTYAAIGKVKRAMKDLGLAVERLEGPPGKRHMLRATKKLH